MDLIKLNTTNSTNSYLRNHSILEGELADYTAVVTKAQTQGRGQMGTIWQSAPHKNLTMSVFKNLSGASQQTPFLVNLVTTLAISKVLKHFSIPKLAIKWPNDILSGDKKICGILIENVIKQNTFTASVIGIGLNVNQTDFENLPQASSLRLITGVIFDLDELMERILQALKLYFEYLETGHYTVLKEAYEQYLFRKNKPSSFRDAQGTIFPGIIECVSDQGHLQVRLEGGVVRSYNLKDITLLY